MAECRYSARLAPATLRNYQATFDLFISIVPAVSPVSLTTGTLTRFFQELETRQRIVGHGKLKKGVKATTVATYRAKLAPFFNWLKQRRYVTVSPFDNIPRPEIIYSEPQYLHREHVQKILAAVGSAINWSNSLIQKRNLAVITVFIYLGLRKSELLNIQVSDVDLIRGELKVNAATSKSKHHKTLPLNPEVLRRLTEYLEARQEAGCTTPYLFAGDAGDVPFTENGLKRVVERIRKKSGVRFHVHQLRHTFAVNLINKGNDISIVQKLMGHRSIVSTMTYLRCIPSETLHRGANSLNTDDYV